MFFRYICDLFKRLEIIEKVSKDTNLRVREYQEHEQDSTEITDVIVAANCMEELLILLRKPETVSSRKLTFLFI